MGPFLAAVHIKKKENCTLFQAAIVNHSCQRSGGKTDDCDGSLGLMKMHLHIKQRSMQSEAAHQSNAPACLFPAGGGGAGGAVASPRRLQHRKFDVVYGRCHLGALREGKLGAGPFTGSLMRVQRGELIKTISQSPRARLQS